MTHKKQPLDTLIIKRTFSATIERVFDAWTKPEILANWFGPEGFEVVHSEVNANAGGRYDIQICSPDNQVIRHFGTYLEVSRPLKLVFTWMLENQACRGSEGLCTETLVSINFQQVGQLTEITLTHEQLPNKQALDGHMFGWESSLNSLTNYFLNDA